VSDLVHYEPTDSWVPMLGAVGDLANKVAGTEFVGKGFRGKPASVAAAILTGRELNLGPMTSLRGLDVIDGRVSMSAQLMAAKIQSAGHRIDWIENSDKAAEVRIVRGDGLGEGTARWTIADAQRAGLAGKQNWARYPRAMLKARALTECAGMVCADVLMGIDAAESTADPAPTGAVTVVQVAPAPVVALQVEPEPEPVAEPEPVVEPEPEPEPQLISVPQMRKLRALLRDVTNATGRPMDPDQAREHISHLAGRALASAKDLTSDEASRVIDLLTEQAALEEASAPVDAEIVEEGAPA